MFGKTDDDLAELRRQVTLDVVYLARYLRQSVDWVLSLTVSDVREYDAALSEIVARENGTEKSEPAGTSAIAGGYQVNDWLAGDRG